MVKLLTDRRAPKVVYGRIAIGIMIVIVIVQDIVVMLPMSASVGSRVTPTRSPSSSG